MTYTKYNTLKLRTLHAFENRGYLSPSAVAVLIRLYPIRAAYSYLRRLHSYGLLDRAQDRRGLILYRLNDRGRRRIVWIRDHVDRRNRRSPGPR